MHDRLDGQRETSERTPMATNLTVRSSVSGRRRTFRAAWLAIAAAALMTAVGCGDSGSSTPKHPDTGVGAGETAPGTVNCMDFCLRGAACIAPLCNEDTMSTNYTPLADLLAAQCSSVCASTPVPAITQAQWQCLFQSSCRQVFEQDICGVQASYSCS
jgi:hypothetical protein